MARTIRGWGRTWRAERRAGTGRAFLLRWIAAVAASMVAGGLLEYSVAVHQVEQRALDEATKSYTADLAGLSAILESDLAPEDQQAAIHRELLDIGGTYGTQIVALFGSDGREIDAVGEQSREVELVKIREVLDSGRPSAQVEADEGQRDQRGLYEFLLPISTSDATFVVEVDQRAEVIGDLLADLRLRKLLGLLLGLLLAVPLSYLLGGQALYRRQRLAEHAADTDALTGLAGRRPFRPALKDALDDSAGKGVVLALIDIDAFKQINDRFGHSHGDRVLCVLAEALSELRASDTAYRLGGDEFAAVLIDCDDTEAVEAVERVREALSEQLPGVTFSCGIATSGNGDAAVLQELWDRADAALYQAKQRGRHQTVNFEDMSNALTVSAAKLDAVHALIGEKPALTVAFQPIWDLRAGVVLGHEVLLRLPAGSPIGGPQEAFELAHRLGLAAELDAAALRTALRSVRSQDWQGLLFLNVHPDSLPRLDVDALVADLLAAGLASSRVVIEVSEHDGLDRPESIRVLKRARARGLRLALDDMGAGNAGLRALARVRFDVVKVDRQVIARLGIDPACDATMAAATTFVRHTGGWIVAEGIEDEDRLHAVLDVTSFPAGEPLIAGQGHLLGRPLPSPTPIGARLDADEAVRGLKSAPGMTDDRGMAGDPQTAEAAIL